MKCIYKIQSKIKPYKFYIGSSVTFDRRKKDHIRYLNQKTHKNSKLQMHINKYGIDDLCFSIVEEVELAADLIKREQYYLDSLNPIFNICKIAQSSLGVKRSPETRAKISKAKKGVKYATFSIAKSKYMQGNTYGRRKHTPEENLKKSITFKKKIIQLDMDGNYVKEWSSQKEAAEGLEIPSSGICGTLKGRQAHTHNIKWRYKDEN